MIFKEWIENLLDENDEETIWDLVCNDIANVTFARRAEYPTGVWEFISDLYLAKPNIFQGRTWSCDYHALAKHVYSEHHYRARIPVKSIYRAVMRKQMYDFLGPMPHHWRPGPMQDPGDNLKQADNLCKQLVKHFRHSLHTHIEDYFRL